MRNEIILRLLLGDLWHLRWEVSYAAKSKNRLASGALLLSLRVWQPDMPLWKRSGDRCGISARHSLQMTPLTQTRPDSFEAVTICGR